MSKELEKNTTISHYKIISAIGKGGMGEVFLAQDTKLDRKVAIKFLNEEFSRDADKLNRFVQEAKAVSALNHPNILTVYEIGEKDEANYIVTEFIEGETLREYLSPKKTNSLNQILKIGVQVAEALSAAHQAGIIHRDIKPENIMIRADGYAKVLDFGLAKLVEKAKSDEISLEGATKALVNTNPGVVMGTVSYMSPEQARGKETDARTDIWSLGVVLYEMLSGRLPFTGETINHTIVSILEKEPLLLENVPDELQRIVRKTLTKEVEMRYQTARDLLIDLKNLRRNLDIQGELERSVIPNREITTDQVRENEAQIYTEKSIAETKAEDAKKTQNVTTSSSLEYAVIQAKSHKFAAAVLGIILLGVISAVAYFGFFAKSNAKQIESIAVMPFVNDSGNADVEYLSDGMTETLIKSLSDLPNLNVKPRSSVFRYKGKDTDLQTIAKELNVQAILNGRVVQRGDQLKLSLELVDVSKDSVIWSEQYNRKQSDLVALQSEIARDISTKLKSKLSGAEAAKVEKKYTENPEAYQLYLKGRYQLNKRTEESFRSGIEFFRQAIERDPNYALAYAGLADAYNQMGMWTTLPPSESFPKAKVAAERALQSDDSLAEAHTALAFTKYRYEWNFAGAEKECQRAISLNPNYAAARELHGYQIYLVNPRRFDEAMRELKTAQEIDPLSQSTNFNIAAMLYHERQYDKALEQLDAIQKLDPNFTLGYGLRAAVYREKGMFDESVAAWTRGSTLEGGGFSKEELDVLRETYKESGFKAHSRKHAELLQAQAKEKYISPIFIAMDYAMIGEKELALLWLDRAYKERSSWLPEINVDPVWDDLRNDPRFKDLLKRMNLPE